MDDPVRCRVVVSGRVQGVFFRDSIRARAQAEGVAGWARNRADGAVEVALEGPAERVQSVLRFLETGPPRARIEHVSVQEEPPEGLTGFEIR